MAPTRRLAAGASEAADVDNGTIVSQRLSAIRKLQENQQDVEARRQLDAAESMSRTWASIQNTNPLTGEPMPELVDWSGAPQVLAPSLATCIDNFLFKFQQALKR